MTVTLRTGPPGPHRDGETGPPETTELLAQLREANETIEVIRGGGVDSLVIGPAGREVVYNLAGADRPYRLIVDAMNEGAATVAAGGRILSVNPCLVRMVGRTTGDLVGTSVLQLVRAGGRARLARLLDVPAGGTARGECHIRGPVGTEVPVVASVSGFDQDGVLRRCLILTDLTPRRAAERAASGHDRGPAERTRIPEQAQDLGAVARDSAEQPCATAGLRATTADLEARIAERTAELAQANAEVDTFTYSIAHDLRGPLRALSGFSAALLDDCGDLLDETGRDYADRIEAASLRMSDVIDDLLGLARVSRTPIDLRTVDLSAEVAAIAEDLRRRDPDRAVRVMIEPGVTATADPALIRSVLQHLMDNAWKFTARRPDASIEFGSTTPPDGPVRYHLRDNGAGFDPAFADKLFRPFQRLHDIGEFPGTGIGLVSIRRIVARHGGRTFAEGEVGHGATFFFTLAAQP